MEAQVGDGREPRRPPLGDAGPCSWLKRSGVSLSMKRWVGWGIAEEAKKRGPCFLCSMGEAHAQYMLRYCSKKGRGRSFFSFPSGIGLEKRSNSLDFKLGIAERVDEKKEESCRLCLACIFVGMRLESDSFKIK